MNLLRRSIVTGLIFCVLGFCPALGQEMDPEILDQMDHLREQLGARLEIQAAELLDQFVFELASEPPFSSPTPVVIAMISTPIGTNHAFGVFIENHLYDVLLKNPKANLVPIHCSICMSTIVKSTPKGTVLYPAGSQLMMSEDLKTQSNVKAALYLDLEAQGTELVLRTRFTTLDGSQKIIRAKSFSTLSTPGAMLQNPGALKSTTEVRQEYIGILKDRPYFHFPFKFIYRDYKATNTGIVPPFIWFELGVDGFVSLKQDWLMGFAIGLSSLDKAHTGFSVGGRLGRLLTGSARSFTRPDLYFISGITLMEIKGTDAQAFLPERPSERDRLLELSNSTPRVSFSAYKFGLELRMQNRYGLTAFIESSPTLKNQKARAVGKHFSTLGFDFQTLGVEVGVWF